MNTIEFNYKAEATITVTAGEIEKITAAARASSDAGIRAAAHAGTNSFINGWRNSFDRYVGDAPEATTAPITVDSHEALIISQLLPGDAVGKRFAALQKILHRKAADVQQLLDGLPADGGESPFYEIDSTEEV